MLSLALVYAAGLLSKKLVDKAAGKSLDAILNEASRRIEAGEFPPNHTIDKTLDTAVMKAMVVLAHRLHNPKVGGMRDAWKRDQWKYLFQEASEALNGGLLSGMAGEGSWLQLFEAAGKDNDKRKTFSLDLVLKVGDGHNIGRFLEGKATGEFRDHLQEELIDWVRADKALSDNGHRPKRFDAFVRQGNPGHHGELMLPSFGDLVLIFFREDIKKEEVACRAVMFNLLTGIQRQMDGVETQLGEVKADLHQISELLATLATRCHDAGLPTDWSAFWSEFRTEMDRQFAEVIAAVEKLQQTVEAGFAQTLADTTALQASDAEILSVAKKTKAMLEEVLQTARLYKHGDFHQLPSLKDKFTGRGEELLRLCADVRQRRQSQPHSAVVTVIHGPGGVGKTEFAVAAGYALLGDCADAQLVLHLGAHSAQPPDAREVRNLLLRLFNPHPDEPLPKDEHTLAERYRLLFRSKQGGSKHALLILDDVADERQVNLLLPPPGSVVLVTARKPLASGEQFPLRKLLPADAAQLLHRFRPAPGLPNDLAAELARLCGYLPVTLTVAGGFLQTRASKPAAEYISELKADPLARLRHEDEALDINVIFARSLRDLSVAQQSAFAAMSVMSADFDRATGVAVGDCNGDELDEIVRLHLLEYEERTGRFEWHDLTREFAFLSLPEPTRRAARLRHALHFAKLIQGQRLAHEIVSRERRHIRSASRFIRKDHELLLKNGTPLRLLNAIQSWLLAARPQRPPREDTHRGRLPMGNGYLALLRGSQWRVSLARKEGDRRKEANALWDTAVFFWRLGKRANAFETAEAALRLFKSLDAKDAMTARAELSRWKKHSELTGHDLRSR